MRARSPCVGHDTADEKVAANLHVRMSTGCACGGITKASVIHVKLNRARQTVKNMSIAHKQVASDRFGRKLSEVVISQRDYRPPVALVPDDSCKQLPRDFVHSYCTAHLVVILSQPPAIYTPLPLPRPPFRHINTPLAATFPTLTSCNKAF